MNDAAAVLACLMLRDAKTADQLMALLPLTGSVDSSTALATVGAWLRRAAATDSPMLDRGLTGAECARLPRTDPLMAEAVALFAADPVIHGELAAAGEVMARLNPYFGDGDRERLWLSLADARAVPPSEIPPEFWDRIPFAGWAKMVGPTTWDAWHPVGSEEVERQLVLAWQRADRDEREQFGLDRWNEIARAEMVCLFQRVARNDPALEVVYHDLVDHTISGEAHHGRSFIEYLVYGPRSDGLTNNGSAPVLDTKLVELVERYGDWLWGPNYGGTRPLREMVEYRAFWEIDGNFGPLFESAELQERVLRVVGRFAAAHDPKVAALLSGMVLTGRVPAPVVWDRWDRLHELIVRERLPVEPALRFWVANRDVLDAAGRARWLEQFADLLLGSPSLTVTAVAGVGAALGDLGDEAEWPPLFGLVASMGNIDEFLADPLVTEGTAVGRRAVVALVRVLRAAALGELDTGMFPPRPLVSVDDAVSRLAVMVGSEAVPPELVESVVFELLPVVYEMVDSVRPRNDFLYGAVRFISEQFGDRVVDPVWWSTMPLLLAGAPGGMRQLVTGLTALSSDHPT